MFKNQGLFAHFVSFEKGGSDGNNFAVQIGLILLRFFENNNVTVCFYSATQGDGASAFDLGCYAPGFQPAKECALTSESRFIR